MSRAYTPNCGTAHHGEGRMADAGHGPSVHLVRIVLPNKSLCKKPPRSVVASRPMGNAAGEAWRRHSRAAAPDRQKWLRGTSAVQRAAVVTSSLSALQKCAVALFAHGHDVPPPPNLYIFTVLYMHTELSGCQKNDVSRSRRHHIRAPSGNETAKRL
jgi:hypothetical protein